MATLSEVLAPLDLPMHRQIQEMKHQHPEFTNTWERGEAQWRGAVRPTAVSDEYEIRIHYRLGDAPRVFVEKPKLEGRGPKNVVPHLYAEGHLCLFLPLGFEWDGRKLVAETIVPWASLWLHHYEVWRATGVWMGGGQHPRRRDRG